MYPHERSLVARLKDQPFALLGLNSDKDLEKLKPRLKEENITWRSFWNGPNGTRGPISQAWNVSSWPTIYVLDHKGVIRFKNVRGEAMDKAVDQLLAEMLGPTTPSGEKAPATEPEKPVEEEKPSAEPTEKPAEQNPGSGSN